MHCVATFDVQHPQYRYSASTVLTTTQFWHSWGSRRDQHCRKHYISRLRNELQAAKVNRDFAYMKHGCLAWIFL